MWVLPLASSKIFPKCCIKFKRFRKWSPLLILFPCYTVSLLYNGISIIHKLDLLVFSHMPVISAQLKKNTSGSSFRSIYMICSLVNDSFSAFSSLKFCLSTEFFISGEVL